MKRGVIRGLWGIYDKSHRITKRRYRMDRDMARIRNRNNNEPFIVYVFGEENYRHAVNNGFDCILINKEPFIFDLVKHQYRHKLEILKYAMEEDGYDEILYMDWDCVPVSRKRLPRNYWDILGQKEVFQACLQVYHRRKAYWRNQELRKVPNGGFVYIRDKSIPQKTIDLWEMLGKQDNDEPAYARLTDDMVGGWKGIEKYWELFEIPFCNLHKASPFPPKKLKEKNVCFIHYQG